ncbi:M15 family metallopeptidase [Actinomadura barringtoniae]|uniref:D-alanyl-D-alanine dipeptidase n=1 Tax=Actinomadura barringtoniae TaxID=1427535 RepID=A0A939T457_9ACTN|nr:M15 family metallopeptidase [Actinomadura barringtoniae]MBO2445477.1 M15 family metallopeptidase [Actinomadura barringtoniae]
MSEIILMSDPRVAAVPVHECGEPLLDLRADSPFLVDGRKQDDSGSYFLLRKGVVERLKRAEEALPAGLRLMIVEGHRSPALQRRYFEGYAAELRAGRPEWSEDEVHSKASRYVSPPDIAPHTAGAAVDLTLAGPDGRELDLGTPMNASPEDSAGACYTGAENISDLARDHRETLKAALVAAGLVNYPTEWWHWSFGDRYWALTVGADCAYYGPLDKVPGQSIGRANDA